MRAIRLIAAAAIAGTSPGVAAQQQAAPSAARAVEPEPTLEELRARAQAGDPDAQNSLGGRLVETEREEALVEGRGWFERAAAAGNAEAKNNLASLLMLGAGGPADEPRARRLREEAARGGSVGAHLTLTEAYARGAGGYPRDPARAFEHARAAAAIRSPIQDFAQWRLAMMHLEGVGTPRDPREAYRILVTASENGGVRAMISRAVMLATGEGTAEDDAQARIWYQRAAESRQYGWEHGLRGLGGMLVLGEGGPVELARGIAYLRVAAAAGDETAAGLLEQFAERVTPALNDEAHGIATAWVAEHLPGD